MKIILVDEAYDDFEVLDFPFVPREGDAITLEGDEGHTCYVVDGVSWFAGSNKQPYVRLFVHKED